MTGNLQQNHSFLKKQHINLSTCNYYLDVDVLKYTKPIRYSKSFTASVDGENIGNMSVIKPKSRGVHKYCPVICMSTFEEFLWTCSCTLKRNQKAHIYGIYFQVQNFENTAYTNVIIKFS